MITYLNLLRSFSIKSPTTGPDYIKLKSPLCIWEKVNAGLLNQTTKIKNNVSDIDSSALPVY